MTKESVVLKSAVKESSVRQKYEKLTRSLIEKGISITTMESCTAGQIASLITDTEGASAILKGGFITYSNHAKILQGVSEETIGKYGVYSRETAAAMAEACRKTFDADIGTGITGSFSNMDPENEDSVPGDVYFAIATASGTESFRCRIPPQKSRLAYKMYAADLIADRLMERI